MILKTKEQKLEYGLRQEKKLRRKFKTYFNCLHLKKIKDQYHSFDFVGILKDNKTTVYIELKSRTNTSTKYDTTMISYSKIVKGYQLLEKGILVYLTFQFTDGCYFYRLENKDSDKQKKIDIYNKVKYLYLKISDLTKINF